MPTLYLVGTPIGNLEDISQRALRILGQVALIAAEDTRTTGRLLQRFGIETPLASYHEYSGAGKVAKLIQTLGTADAALVSDAGMPGLSDPGYRLVQAAIEAGIEVVAIPGPSAVTTALVSSGLPTDRFLFLGFLPRQRTARRDALAAVAGLSYTLVLFEAPHRLLAMLEDVEQVLGDRQISVGRELTKLHEETWRGPISQARAYFGLTKIRGEFTLVIAGATMEDEQWDETAVRSAMSDELSKGVARKKAAAIVAGQSGWRKRDVYGLSLEEGDSE